MALSRTARDLEALARMRADMVGSNFRDSEAFRLYLTGSCRALVSMLLRHGDDYFLESTTVSTTANSRFTTVPTGQWKLVSLRTTISGTRDKLKRATIDELDEEVTPQGWSSGLWPKYRLRGRNIVWVPIPTAVHTVTVEYVPTAIFRDASDTASTALNDLTDTFESVFGWDDWVAVHTAMKVKADAGKSVTALRDELNELTEQVVLAASSRDAEEAPEVRDIWDGGSEPESDMAP